MQLTVKTQAIDESVCQSVKGPYKTHNGAIVRCRCVSLNLNTNLYRNYRVFGSFSAVFDVHWCRVSLCAIMCFIWTDMWKTKHYTISQLLKDLNMNYYNAMSPFWLVAVSVCRHSGLLIAGSPFWRVAIWVCHHFDHRPFGRTGPAQIYVPHILKSIYPVLDIFLHLCP